MFPPGRRGATHPGFHLAKNTRPVSINRMTRTPITLLALTGMILTGPALDGDTPHSLLREQFEDRVRTAVESHDGVFGLVFKDLSSGESLSFNENLAFTQASVIKIPILVELFRRAQEDGLDLEAPVTVSGDDFTGGAGILRHLTPGGVSMSLRDLAILMIVESDNTATNIIIDRLGMNRINQTMEELGLPGTRVQRIMMDRRARLEDRENLSTPAETARLLEMLHRGEILDETSRGEILDILAIRKDGRISRHLPRGTRVESKGGSVGGVINDVGIVHIGERAFIVSAMINWHLDRDAAEEAIAEVALLAWRHVDRLENFNRYGHRK